MRDGGLSTRAKPRAGEERSPNDIDKALGMRIRARRIALGVTQELMAAKLGVTFQQIQKYERGVNRIAASRLYDIAAVLETPVADLFDGVDDPVEGETRATVAELRAALALPGAAELVRCYGGIVSPQARMRALELMRALAADSSASGDAG